MEAKTIAVIGLGTFGYELCLELTKKGCKVIAVDKNPIILEKIKELVYQSILIDSTDEDAMKMSPIDSVDIGIVAMASDIQASILTTAILKNFSIPYIIARASTSIQEQILSKIGANEVINIEVEQGKRVAAKISSPTLIDQYQISDTFSFIELLAPTKFCEHTLPQLNLRQQYKVNVILIKRKTTSIDEFGNAQTSQSIIIPDAQVVIQENDILLIIGDNNYLEIVKEL